jgi:hypothetical protein
MMDKVIAYCGLICNDCPAFIATKEDNQRKRIDLAKKWSSESYTVTPADISCMGCTSNCGSVFKFCGECEIRICGLEKEVLNCAYCNDYPCDKLDKPFEMSPQNKELLDKIKLSI